MNHTIKKTKSFLLILTVAFALGGCRASRVSTENDSDMPAGFSFLQDTADVAGPEKEFVFSDPALVRLIDEAVKNNRDVLIATERIEEARAYFRYNKGAMLPAAGIEASAGVQKFGDYTMEGAGNYDTNLSTNISGDQKTPVPHTPDYFLGLKSFWEIDLWGKLKNRKKAAYLQWLASKEGMHWVTTSLVAEVAIRYYELLALDAEREVLQRNINLQDSAVKIAEVQKEVGRTTELGVQQFKAQLLRTQSLLLKTEQQINQAEHEINFLLGRLPQEVERSRNLTDSLPGSFVSELPLAILNSRPDVQQAELLLKAGKADVAAAKAALLPALTLAPFAGYHSFKSTLLFDPGSIAYGILGGLTAPLLNRSAAKSNIMRAEAAKQQAYHHYFKTVLEAAKEVSASLASLQKLEEIYRLNRQEVALLAGAVSTSNELYKAGYASYLEVISAQGNAIEAEINAIETKKAMRFNLIYLYRATGGGWKH